MGWRKHAWTDRIMHKSEMDAYLKNSWPKKSWKRHVKMTRDDRNVTRNCAGVWVSPATVFEAAQISRFKLTGALMFYGGFSLLTTLPGTGMSPGLSRDAKRRSESRAKQQARWRPIGILRGRLGFSRQLRLVFFVVSHSSLKIEEVKGLDYIGECRPLLTLAAYSIRLITSSLIM